MNDLNEEKLKNVTGGKSLGAENDACFTPIRKLVLGSVESVIAGAAEPIMAGRSYKFRCFDCDEVFYRSAGDPETCPKCGSASIARCP